MEASVSAARPAGFGRAVVRPVLAFLLASAVASLPLALGAVVGPFGISWVSAQLSGAPYEVQVDVRTLALLVPVGWLYAFGITAAIMAAPSLIAAWIGHAVRAPRPLADMTFGAAFGFLTLMAIAFAPLPDSDALRPISKALAVGVFFALSGALGGWIYALVAGRRA